jgi:hypothetical protein
LDVVSARSTTFALVALVRLVFTERPDVVHAHRKAGTLGRLAAFLYNGTRSCSRRCLVVRHLPCNVLDGYFGPAGTVARGWPSGRSPESRMLPTISPSPARRIVAIPVAPPERVRWSGLPAVDEFFAIGHVDRGFRLGLGLLTP